MWSTYLFLVSALIQSKGSGQCEEMAPFTSQMVSRRMHYFYLILPYSRTHTTTTDSFICEFIILQLDVQEEVFLWFCLKRVPLPPENIALERYPLYAFYAVY